MRILEIVVASALSASPFGAAGEALLKAAVEGRKCKTASFDDTQLNCKFKIDTAAFEVAGVGASDAQIAIDHADGTATYISFGLRHQCVAVKNPKAVVWISPKNAKVYDNWQDCSVASSQGK